MSAEIVAIEYYLPKKKISNKEIVNDNVDYNLEKFEKKVGIKSRHVTGPDEYASDLAIKAVEKLAKRTDVNLTEVDMIIYCTQSPDYILPSNASIIHDKFNLSKKAAAFDINLGCSGYTYGLMMAKAFINSKSFKCVLLITADTYSKYINDEDYTNRLIFGDGATATVVKASQKNSLFEFVCGTDGSGYDKLIIKEKVPDIINRKSDLKVKNYGVNKYTDSNLYMNGPEIFKFTLSEIPKLTMQTLKKNQLELTEINYYIFHQANSFLIETLRKSIGIDSDKFYNDIKETGNTVSSTVPIALKLHASKMIKKEEIVLLSGFGVGLSMCSGIVRIKNNI